MSEKIPSELKYTEEHEWARLQGSSAVVGVTDHAQGSLGDVVYVELPKVGATLTKGKQFGVIESTKAVSELYAPLSGKVLKVNSDLTDNPTDINTDPYGDGWILELELTDTQEVSGLLSAEAYADLLKNA
ncbi:glycine cleavage system protein GcvH [Corallococcus sp. H22C18031201]|uniref:glycine cleavage system protein GcvH n=1 Tax=Citreicoccus inhibens TaxID=2849499 RepID=UPI000E715AA8|nr:glycine cleavage system protein GcvH [Citreicoccus inhibens]MBU8900076.1 glycine cleavage system protein GcvH [Citreicoccus inhibens]RJS20677.1 glycine cleavage system protein GcvH [Corallococcus sp. H22C18031201]